MRGKGSAFDDNVVCSRQSWLCNTQQWKVKQQEGQEDDEINDAYKTRLKRVFIWQGQAAYLYTHPSARLGHWSLNTNAYTFDLNQPRGHHLHLIFLQKLALHKPKRALAHPSPKKAQSEEKVDTEPAVLPRLAPRLCPRDVHMRNWGLGTGDWSGPWLATTSPAIGPVVAVHTPLPS